MIVLIPSFEPDDRLEQIVGDLITQSGLHVVVVDDGSGPEYADHMSAVADLGATVLTHPVNRGKGAALRTGIEHILQAHPGESVVCADSDGQHSPVDVLRVAARLDEGDSAMVLGVRRFTGRVPMRSRVGNGVTARLFRALTGISLGDTQTGLRAYPAATLPWLLTIPGDRFEWELRVLLAAARDHRPIEQVEIATIYLEENASSHFRPLQDSARIYRQLLGFASSSLAGFALDAALLAVLVALGVPLVWSVLAARVVSASANYALNRRWVFGRGETPTPHRIALPRYAALAGVILVANELLIHALVNVTGSLVVSKLVTELALFSVSFAVQRTVVFARSHQASRDAATADGIACEYAATTPPQ